MMLNALLASTYVLVGSFRGVVSFNAWHLVIKDISVALPGQFRLGVSMSEYPICDVTVCGFLEFRLSIQSVHTGSARPLLHPHSRPANILLCECFNHCSKCDLAHCVGPNLDYFFRVGCGCLPVILVVEARSNR